MPKRKQRAEKGKEGRGGHLGKTTNKTNGKKPNQTNRVKPNSQSHEAVPRPGKSEVGRDKTNGLCCEEKRKIRKQLHGWEKGGLVLSKNKKKGYRRRCCRQARGNEGELKEGGTLHTPNHLTIKRGKTVPASAEYRGYPSHSSWEKGESRKKVERGKEFGKRPLEKIDRPR